MDIINFERNNTFYYSNYLYLPEVQKDLINNRNVIVDIDKLHMMSCRNMRLYSLRLNLIELNRILNHHLYVGNVNVVRCLYTRQSIISATSLNQALIIGKLDLVNWILDNTDSQKLELLVHMSVANGYLELLKVLLSRVDENIESLKFIARVSNQTEILRYLNQF